jgi:dihydrofolate synthase/folylpolyglutamate synthase
VCNQKNARIIKVEKSDSFNINNYNTVKAVLSLLNINDDFELVKPPARQERLGNVLLDGGHNVESAKALAPLLNNEVAVIGMMSDKDVDGYMSLIAPHCKRIITTTPKNPRSISAVDLKEIAKKYCDDVLAVDNSQVAVEKANENNELTLVCGSFFLAREVRKLLL